ncbi:MAG: single-stranded DNA-binding protein [Spirochaetaceae bacterium]|jgi:single-strand DNA-binding protein|nr:single-stranded DNA-binding protein [Spirochaetaceae bacterium]
MNLMNNVIVEGHLVRDPEAGLTPKGTPFCRFSLAYNNYFKRKDEKEHNNDVSFFDVEVWSDLAEFSEKYLKKGKGIRIVGRLRQDRWTDEKGSNRSKIKIVGQQLDFIPGGRPTASQENKQKEAVQTY